MSSPHMPEVRRCVHCGGVVKAGWTAHPACTRATSLDALDPNNRKA